MQKVQTKIFEKDNIPDALEACQTAGYRVLFMPEFADRAIIAPKNSRIWTLWYSTPSIRATGATAQGNAVNVYGHVDNYFSNFANIRAAIKAGLINGAGQLPQPEFQRLLGLEDNLSVFVVDNAKLCAWPSGIYGIDEPAQEHMQKYGGKINGIDMIAINHPQTIPFLGGRERAEKYLLKHKKVRGNQIGIRYCNDSGSQSMGRLLAHGNYFSSSLLGFSDLNCSGRFFGVRDKVVAVGDAKSIAPNLEQQILTLSGDYVPKAAMTAWESELHKLFE